MAGNTRLLTNTFTESILIQPPIFCVIVNVNVLPASAAAGVKTGSAPLAGLSVPAIAGLTVQPSVPVLAALPNMRLSPTHTNPWLPASGAALSGLSSLLAVVIHPLASVAVNVNVVGVFGFAFTVVFNALGLVTSNAGDHW